jgi:PhnB protein
LSGHIDQEATMEIQPYLLFNGNAEEAVRFYERALGAKLDMLMRFREAPDPPPPGMIPENWGDKVMHASFHVGGSTVMVSDGCSDTPGMNGFSLSVAAADVAEAQRVFDALSADGKVTMPLGPTFWSPAFGMLVDRFGVSWMLNVQP